MAEPPLRASGSRGFVVALGAIGLSAAIGWTLGIDPRMLIGGRGDRFYGSDQSQVQQPSPDRSQQELKLTTPKDETGRFVSAILGETEATWKEIFAQEARTYRPPVLVLYTGLTQTACGGIARSTVGPFYCPIDQRVYLDTSFFREIATRYRGCDVDSKACMFSDAYVIAHEVGHHIQNLLGILPKVQKAKQATQTTSAANHLQVQVELQADCLAGLWANNLNKRFARKGVPSPIEPGDIEAALQTAAALGNDALQRKAQGYEVPDSFTHGSAEQRQRWFNKGFESGAVSACNTFAAAQL
jgi:predicted metalloprotease